MPRLAALAGGAAAALAPVRASLWLLCRHVQTAAEGLLLVEVARLLLVWNVGVRKLRRKHLELRVMDVHEMMDRAQDVVDAPCLRGGIVDGVVAGHERLRSRIQRADEGRVVVDVDE